MAALQQRQRVVRRRLLDRVSATGVCDVVLGHEPYKEPVRGQIVGAVVNGPSRTVPQASTLAYTAKWLAFTIHFYRSIPLDGEDGDQAAIDPLVSDARDTVEADLNLTVDSWGSEVEFDPLGAYGEPLRSIAGYLDHGGTQLRTETIECGFIAFNAYPTSRSA